jgi:hypothetical protein
MSGPPPLPPRQALSYASAASPWQAEPILAEFVVPQRSERAIRVMQWIRISQMLLALVPILVVVLARLTGLAVGPLGWLGVGFAGTIVVWLALDLLHFNSHARRVQWIGITPTHLRYTTLSGGSRQFLLDDLEEVVIAPREFSLGDCADLYVRSIASRELERLLVMYDRPVVADAAAQIERYRKPLP